jgi:hypothetical protein
MRTTSTMHARVQKILRTRAPMCCEQRHQKNIGEIRIFCTRVTIECKHTREVFSGDARNFFVRAIAKHVSTHPNIFSQAAVFGRSRDAESIKNERISAN